MVKGHLIGCGLHEYSLISTDMCSVYVENFVLVPIFSRSWCVCVCLLLFLYNDEEP